MAKKRKISDKLLDELLEGRDPADLFGNEGLLSDLKKALAVFDALIIAVLGLLVCVAALSLLMPIMQVGGNIR